jgi:hypothetical protein
MRWQRKYSQQRENDKEVKETLQQITIIEIHKIKYKP